MKPVIGITTSYIGEASPMRIFLKETYSNEIRQAGGLPMLLPLDINIEDIKEYTARLDGILFSGGADLSPHLFNEEPMWELNCLLSSRDNTELGLMKAARDLRMPIFGICRGCQTINVALGGTLYQDIQRQVPGSHGHYPKDTPACEAYHSVSILDAGSYMAEVFKQSVIRTNSFHHQSVKKLAEGLRLTAQTSDGIVEAFQGVDPGWYVHAVQFHPEAMSSKYPEFHGLFVSFIEACRKKIGDK